MTYTATDLDFLKGEVSTIVFELRGLREELEQIINDPVYAFIGDHPIWDEIHDLLRGLNALDL